MFSSPRTLIIPLDGDTLAVSVDGEDAVLDLGPAGRARAPETDEPPEESAGGPPKRAVLHLRVPARALVAAVRVAWAAEHDRGRFEPWRDRGGPPERPSHLHPPYRRSSYDRHDEGYDAEYDRYDDAVEDGYARYGDACAPWYDDLGDGDPAGFRDPTVVPFPYRPTPTPARSGALWEAHEHRTLREMWLAAAPDADKTELVRTIATRLERGVGGISARLRVAGCDPTRPGSAWDGPGPPGEPDEPAGEPVVLDGSG